ncbi:ferric iron reductase FhuF [Skermanella aerolata]|uniref:Ferric iron reductase FhuF n=1 Tax=Skermanella aerolata TaxID=393310 RepID=A0A512DL62_9PROT|nr:siderophore-iron reductase FhuF [Skermanella aerolata]KJB92899.1 iron reductase [Skermanella aerolata KACC 11604]GEO37211.1 ferric iron reductase FhuF [Skermanella aerolata]
MTVPRAFPFLDGPSGRFGARLVPRGDAPGAIPCGSLIEAGGLETALAELIRRHPDAERRALLSLWSRHYFYSLIPSVVLSGLDEARVLPLRLSETAVVLNGDGVPAAVALPHEGAVDPGTPVPDRLIPLARDHLEPLIDGLAAQARLSPRVLWGNAAGYLHWVVEQLDTPAGTEADALIHSPSWPGGWKNALDEPMRYTDCPDARQARRKVCCLLYRVPGRKLCSYCPLLERKHKERPN